MTRAADSLVRMRRARSGLTRDTDGAVAVMAAVLLAGLLGVSALVFDLGRAWTLHTELQGAVDAAALAGAGQLDGRPGARVRAAQAATSALARNDQIFANVSGPGAVTFSTAYGCRGDGCAMINENFRFLRSLSPRVDALRDADARFVEVRVARTAGFSFAGLVGAPTTVSPQARAVAGLRTFVCGQARLLICNPDEPAGNVDPGLGFDAAGHSGRGITLRESRGALSPSEFAWLAVVRCDAQSDRCTTEAGEGVLAEALGDVTAPQACLEGTAVVQPGALTEVAELVNTRMDIYPADDVAGRSFDPRFQPSPNYLTGLVADPGGACALTVPDNPFLGPGRHPPHGTEPLDHVGYPRDDCAYTEACALGDGLWDLDAYMAHHHPGVVVNTVVGNLCPASGCSIGGARDVDLDGDRRLSRWEVHRWELGGHLPDFGRPQCFGGGTASLPQPPATDPRVPDRRLLGGVVVNCGALAHSGRAIEDVVDLHAGLARPDPVVTLFLTEAMGELAPDALYAEIVGPAAIDGPPVAVSRTRVVLNE